MTNEMTRILERLERLPSTMRSYILGKFVPFVGTAGLVFEKITTDRVVVRVKDRRRVRNHIRTIHAAAVALVAETATGFVVAMHLPDDKVPLIKTLHVNFVRRSQGAITAEAWLEPEQIERIRNDEKGEVTVPVTLTDDGGATPVLCEMTWAWVSKRRSAPESQARAASS